MGGCRVLRDLDEWLNSIDPNLGKKKRPGLKELWKSGDLREKLAAVNAKISSIRIRWQVRGAAQVSEADFVEHHHDQIRLQVSTLVSTNVVLGRLDSAHTDTTAQFQQIIAMLQQGPVRQRSRSRSMDSQVDTPYPSTILSTRPPRLPMEAIGATSAIVGLAIPVFKYANELRDKFKLVRYPPHLLHALRALIIIVRRSHRRKQNFWQHSPNMKRISTSSSHSITTTRNYWTSMYLTPT